MGVSPAEQTGPSGRRRWLIWLVVLLAVVPMVAVLVWWDVAGPGTARASTRTAYSISKIGRPREEWGAALNKAGLYANESTPDYVVIMPNPQTTRRSRIEGMLNAGSYYLRRRQTGSMVEQDPNTVLVQFENGK